jgi:hypothetical protein
LNTLKIHRNYSEKLKRKIQDDDIRIQVAERYIDLYERVTGKGFVAELADKPVLERIQERIAEYF